MYVPSAERAVYAVPSVRRGVLDKAFWTDSVKLNGQFTDPTSYDAFATRANIMDLPSVSAVQYSRDLFKALERHQKEEDQKDNLKSILTSTHVYIEEVGPLDIGGGISVINLKVRDGIVEIWLKDPIGSVRYYKCSEDKLLGSKHIKEVVVKAIQG